jgi:hypothetical protein
MSEQFKHEVVVIPSHYLIREKDTENYGVSTCRLIFYVIGERGAVQLMLGTDWGIQRVQDHLNKFGWSHNDNPRQPRGWDLGYHSRTSHYEDQTSMKCDLLPEGVCYYDGSSLNADEWIEGLLAGGTVWLWPRLEQYYRCTFEGDKYPDLTPIYKKHPKDGGTFDPPAKDVA